MEKWSYYFKSGNRQTYSFLEQNSAETRYIRAATGSIPRGMKFGTESHTFLDADECCSWIVISQYRFARGVRDYTILFPKHQFCQKHTVANAAPDVYKKTGVSPRLFVFNHQFKNSKHAQLIY